MKNDFKKKLQQLLEIKDIKQIELAVAIGVTEATISRYVNGVQFPRHEVICKMAKYFEVSTDYLMGKEPTESEIEEMELIRRFLIKKGFMSEKDAKLGIDGLKKLFDFYQKNEDLFK